MICVSINIAKGKHNGFILSSEGEVLADIFTIPNNAEGFNTLLQTIRRRSSSVDKRKVYRTLQLQHPRIPAGQRGKADNANISRHTFVNGLTKRNIQTQLNTE